MFTSQQSRFGGPIHTYVLDVQQGRPVAGFVEQFKEMVARFSRAPNNCLSGMEMIY